jgi:pSer/pThr/pTyr-binding forkhead associated (FHA) protein
MIKLTLKTQAGEAELKSYNYEFDQPVVTLGRLKENDIQLPQSTVSGFHAQILKEAENYYLVDRGSINGTFLNNQRLLAGEKKLLQDGDTIKIQTFELYFTSGVTVMPVDQGATIQVARQMVMELLGSWESQQEPRIIVMGGPQNGKQVELVEGKTIVIGRGTHCDIQIDHPTISRKHAEISFSWNGAFVKDLQSANGVYCNDSRIDGTYKLRDRDEVRLGQQNSPDPVRLIFSNPAEALLSKIEEAQITDGSPGAVEAKNVTAEQAASAEPLPEAPVQPPVDPALPQTEVPPVPQEQTPPYAGPPVPEPVTPSKGMSSMTMGLLIGGVLILLFSIVAIGLLLYTGKNTVVEQKATPETGTTGDVIVISGKDIKAQSVKRATIMEREAAIVETKEDAVHLRVPSFPNIPAGTQQTDITLESDKGTVAKAPFTLVILPDIQKMDPVSGRSGSVVNLNTSAATGDVEVYFGTTQATIVSRTRGRVSVNVPEIGGSIPDAGLKVPVTLGMSGTRSKQSKEFLVLPGMRIQAMTPSAANPGAEVRIQVDEVPAGVSVYFGNAQAAIKSTGANEITVTVPPTTETIPEGGRIVPVQLKVNHVPVGPKSDFTLIPEYVESFQLSFAARPYGNPLGFNEYSVATNIGPFLVVVAKDQYGSSKSRAEVIARNLNDKIPFFRQNLSARIALDKVEGVYSIFAESEILEQRELLLRIFPDDALAYSKITQRSVSVDALAEWWKMLIDSYYKVFVQIQSPSTTGIMSAGGSILQQIYNFYSLKTAQGFKYYKKDLVQTLPDDQRTRLVALSLSPPKKLMSVDGKWGGKMSNILHPNISDPELELVLTLRQSDGGSVSGTAEVNWKVGMGRNSGGFENVAYKKLGTFPLSGMFRRSQSFPLEFSFVDKSSRRLNFVGKLEGEALVGSFQVSSTGEEGTWSVRLR